MNTLGSNKNNEKNTPSIPFDPVLEEQKVEARRAAVMRVLNEKNLGISNIKNVVASGTRRIVKLKIINKLTGQKRVIDVSNYTREKLERKMRWTYEDIFIEEVAYIEKDMVDGPYIRLSWEYGKSFLEELISQLKVYKAQILDWFKKFKK